jgi:hypothetical protein
VRKAKCEQEGDTPGEDRVRWIVVREGAKQQWTERAPKARVRRVAVTIGKAPAGVVGWRHVPREEAVSPR